MFALQLVLQMLSCFFKDLTKPGKIEGATWYENNIHFWTKVPLQVHTMIVSSRKAHSHFL